METITLSAAVIALTQFVRMLIPGVNGWLTVVIAAGLGLAAGMAGIEGHTPLTGLLAGLAAVGVHTTGRVVARTETLSKK